MIETVVLQNFTVLQAHARSGGSGAVEFHPACDLLAEVEDGFSPFGVRIRFGTGSVSVIRTGTLSRSERRV